MAIPLCKTWRRHQVILQEFQHVLIPICEVWDRGRCLHAGAASDACLIHTMYANTDAANLCNSRGLSELCYATCLMQSKYNHICSFLLHGIKYFKWREDSLIGGDWNVGEGSFDVGKCP